MENEQVIFQQAKKYDCFYLYDERKIVEHTDRLKRDFSSVEFLYSIKANSAPAVVKCVIAQGFGADAASLAEVELAHEFDVPADKIQYSAPGKRMEDIGAAMDISTLIADSIGEIARIQEIAKAKNTIAEIGIRINPDFTFSDGAGTPSKFGIDEKQAFSLISEWEKLQNVRIVGIHVHSRSQELNANVLERYYRKMFSLADAFQNAIGRRLRFLNMGSGLGIPYSSGDEPLDTASLGAKTEKLMEQFTEKLTGVSIILETGRYAVGKSGCYVTQVLDRKESMGTTFVILADTLNGFIRPCLAQLITSYSKDDAPIGSEPLFTGRDAFQFVALTDETELEKVTLAGNLCTATDIVAKDIIMPKLKRGDLVAITNAGSYAAVLSPVRFSSQVPPAELFLSCHGTVSDASKI